MDDLALKLKYLIEQQKIDEKEEKPPTSNEKQTPKPDENIPNEKMEKPSSPDDNVDVPDNTEEGMEDGGMGEEGMEDDSIGAANIGYVYELNQIHHRLISIRNHLDIFVEEEFDELKQSLTKAIKLFELVVNNYVKYSDKIEIIIVMYYKFLKNIYEIAQKKYKKYSKKVKKKNDRI